MIPSFTRRRMPVSLTGYAAVVAADNPIAWWRLQETGGTVLTDSTPNPNNMTIQGYPTLNLAGIAGSGSTGRSILINSSSDYGVTYGGKANISAPITYELWYFQSALNSTPMTLLCGSYVFALSLGQINAGSTVNPQVGAYNTSWSTAGDSVQPVAGTWHHLVGTQDTANNLTLYVDGVQVDSIVGGGYKTTVSTVYLGQYFNNSYNQTSGVQLAEPAIYNKSLTLSQVQAHYNAGL